MDLQARHYLDRYLSGLRADKRGRYKVFDAGHFCADEENANLCADLVLKGEKRATASLLWSYEAENEPLPTIGRLTVVTDWNNRPACIIETTAVEVQPFNAVTAQFAFEEGEGDKSLAFWHKVHWQYFSAECDSMGRQPSESMPVVLERFKKVYPL